MRIRVLDDRGGERCATFELSRVLCAPGCLTTLQLEERRSEQAFELCKSSGEVRITASICKSLLHDSVHLRLGASCLERSWFISNNPYLAIVRSVDGVPTRVWTSAVVKNTASPTWPAESFALSELCGGNLSAPFRIECWNSSKIGGHTLIGAAEVSVQSLLGAPRLMQSFALLSAKQEPHGQLEVLQAALRHAPSFIEFIAAGCRLQFCAVLDLGIARDASDTGAPSLLMEELAQTLRAVETNLMQYCRVPCVPAVYGFGNRVTSKGQVPYCLSLTYNADAGVGAILRAHEAARETAPCLGDAFFVPVIAQIAAVAGFIESSVPAQYLVALVVTSRDATDVDDVVLDILRTSHLPVSIVIVGIGPQPFLRLQGLRSEGSDIGMRDVQDMTAFVRFRTVSAAVDSRGGDAVAAAALRCIPAHAQDYFRRRGLALAGRRRSSGGMFDCGVRGACAAAAVQSAAFTGLDTQEDAARPIDAELTLATSRAHVRRWSEAGAEPRPLATKASATL